MIDDNIKKNKEATLRRKSWKILYMDLLRPNSLRDFWKKILIVKKLQNYCSAMKLKIIKGNALVNCKWSDGPIKKIVLQWSHIFINQRRIIMKNRVVSALLALTLVLSIVAIDVSYVSASSTKWIAHQGRMSKNDTNKGNTVAAFKNALKKGAAAIETDVMITKPQNEDFALICSHDAEYKKPPTLNEYLKLINEKNKKSKTKVYAVIELKNNPTNWPKWKRDKYYNKLLKVIKDNNMEKYTIIYSLKIAYIEDLKKSKVFNKTGIRFVNYETKKDSAGNWKWTGKKVVGAFKKSSVEQKTYTYTKPYTKQKASARGIEKIIKNAAWTE